MQESTVQALISLSFPSWCLQVVFTNEGFVAACQARSAIFPTVFARFVSLHHVLVILAVLQIFSFVTVI